ncbi:MAG: HAD family hydrolase [Rubrobacter sp.]|nr:HAD family hydrolase [Rubrobacter sp.]
MSYPEDNDLRTIVLDLDGTVLDGSSRLYACYRSILEERGYTPVGFESYRRMRRERVDRRQQLAVSGAGEVYESFLSEWLERIEHPDLLTLDRLQPNAVRRLTEWRAAGLRLVLATIRRYPDRLHEQLARLGLTPLLDHIAVCEHRLGGAGKAREVEHLVPGLRPEECLWIGDTELDVEAARALGCPVWAVTGGERTEAYLASLRPDFLSPDLQSVDLEHCSSSTNKPLQKHTGGAVL